MPEIIHALTITVYGHDDDPFYRVVKVVLRDKASGEPRASATYRCDTEAATKECRDELSMWFTNFMNRI